MFSSAGCFQWKNSLIVIRESIFDSVEVVLFLYYALVLGGDVLFLAKPLMMKNPFLISIFYNSEKINDQCSIPLKWCTFCSS